MNSWKRVLQVGLILLGALVLQQTMVRWIAFGPIRPDLTLIALTAISLRHGSIVGLYAGMTMGLVQDVYAIDTLGANALAKCLVGYGLGFFEEEIVKIMPATRVFLLGLAFALHDLIFYLAAGLRGKLFWSALLGQSIPSAVYTLLLGAIVFYYSANLKPREA